VATKSPPASGSKSQSIDEILTIPKAAAKAQKITVGLTNTAQHVSESPFPESPFLHQLRDKKAAREEKQKPKMKSKAKPQGKKLNSKRKVRSPKTYRSATACTVTCSQAHAKAKVDTSEDGPKEECSVQDDQEGGDECFCGVCEVKYGAEFESKIWILCSNLKAWYHTSCVEVEDNNIPRCLFLCVLNALRVVLYTSHFSRIKR